MPLLVVRMERDLDTRRCFNICNGVSLTDYCHTVLVLATNLTKLNRPFGFGTKAIVPEAKYVSALPRFTATRSLVAEAVVIDKDRRAVLSGS